MNKLLALLLLFSSLAFAQEITPEPNKTPPNVTVVEIDPRCSSAVLWSAQLINGRRGGTELDSVLQRIAYDIQFGALRSYPAETVNYLLNIIVTVYDAKSVQTDVEIIEIFNQVHSDCIDFIEGPSEQPKIST